MSKSKRKNNYFCHTLICLFTINLFYGCSTVYVAPLDSAIEQDNTKRAKQILEQENALRFINSSHFTSAVVKRQKEIVVAILDAGVNVDLPDRSIDDTTPLMHATNCGYPEIVKILIERGANVDAVDKKGRTPLILVSQRNPEQFFTSLRIAQPEFDDKLEIAKLLLNNGADSNKVTEIGFPMNFAGRENNIEMIKLLIDNGADVNLKDKYGVTALTQACYQNSLSAVKYLVARGANIESSNNNDYTPLMLASGKGYHELADYLIDLGAKINGENRYSITPLFLAASGGHKKVTKNLFMRKAKLNIVDKYPYETAKSHKFMADHYLDMIEDQNSLINYYNIAAEYFGKASSDLTNKSYKLWQLASKRAHYFYQGLDILIEDLDFIFDRYPFEVRNAVQSGLTYGFDDSNVNVIQSNFVKKIIDSNRLYDECSSIALCYKDYKNEQAIRTCIKGVEE